MKYLADIKVGIKNILDKYVGYINDNATRRDICLEIEQYLYDNVPVCINYEIHCDKTNNPPSVIAANQLNIDVTIHELNMMLNINNTNRFRQVFKQKLRNKNVNS